MTTIHLGQDAFILHPPRSFAIAYNVVHACALNPAARLGAALGACWPGALPWEIRYSAATAPVLYGAEVFSRACEAHPWQEVVAAGEAALALVDSMLPSQQEEADTLGNSKGPAADTSGPSSQSAASTDAISTGGAT